MISTLAPGEEAVSEIEISDSSGSWDNETSTLMTLDGVTGTLMVVLMVIVAEPVVTTEGVCCDGELMV